jgi:hypothetical protein
VIAVLAASVKLHDVAEMLTATNVESIVLAVGKFVAGWSQPFGYSASGFAVYVKFATAPAALMLSVRSYPGSSAGVAEIHSQSRWQRNVKGANSRYVCTDRVTCGLLRRRTWMLLLIDDMMDDDMTRSNFSSY